MVLAAGHVNGASLSTLSSSQARRMIRLVSRTDVRLVDDDLYRQCSDILCDKPVHAKGLCQHHYDVTPERRAHFRAKHHKDPTANYKRTIRRLRARIRDKEELIDIYIEMLMAFNEPRVTTPVYDPAAEQREGH